MDWIRFQATNHSLHSRLCSQEMAIIDAVCAFLCLLPWTAGLGSGTSPSTCPSAARGCLRRFCPALLEVGLSQRPTGGACSGPSQGYLRLTEWSLPALLLLESLLGASGLSTRLCLQSPCSVLEAGRTARRELTSTRNPPFLLRSVCQEVAAWDYPSHRSPGSVTNSAL